MKLSEISIKRPVLATVLNIVVVLIGILGLSRLAVREYPDVDPPIISVSTFYRGANAGVVETEVTNILEEEFATLQGVKTITSSSVEQGSSITIEFDLDRDVDVAGNDVRDRVSRVRGRLPQEAEDPVVAKVDADAQPIIWLGLKSEVFSPLEITETAELVVRERLLRVPGVGRVFIGAARRYAMRIWIDPLRLAAHGLTTADVESTIRRANAEIPGGRVEGNQREFAVRTRGELVTQEEFASIVLTQRGDDVVRLRDVAEVVVGAEDDRTIARFNGTPTVGLGIVKLSGASTVDVAEEIRAALPGLAESVPEGMDLFIAYDSSTYIEDSVDEVAQTLFIAMLLVIIVVLFFLKSPRATLIPLLAIPISIVGTFAFTYFLGYSVNVLTLLALVLSIGLVVDDAIVMLENIYRHMEMGKSRMQAAMDGAKEIGFAVIATTVALVAVFIPLAFLTGSVGRLFNEFGVSIAIAVTISTFVALTLSPMLCSRVLRPLHTGKQNLASRSFDAFFRFLDRIYRGTLQVVVRHRLIVSAVTIMLIGAGLYLFNLLPQELTPTEDRGTAFGIMIAPEGATLEYSDRYMRRIEEILLPVPEREGLFTATGLGFGGPGQVTNGFLFFLLKPKNERERSQQEIVASLFPQIYAIPGVDAYLINPSGLGGNTQPVSYVIQGDDYSRLNEVTDTMMVRLAELGYLVQPRTDLELNKPQLDISIDRRRAAGLGVSVADIGATLEMLLGGRRITQFKRGTKQYDVIAQMRPSERSTPDEISELYVRGNGGLVQLATVVNVQETVAPKELNHYNRQRSVTITANLAPGVGLGDALEDMDRIAAEVLPEGMTTDVAGTSFEYRNSSSNLYFMFIFAVIFIYLVLAAQFESFIDPITILLAVPLAVVGALFSLWLFDLTMNIYSQIGLIMLIGLVAKNLILIVEFANQLRERGETVLSAVVEASAARLRPILMTAFSTVFGILPIALGIGAGGEARQPLGVAVVGGMLFSTFLTLVLVPVLYTILARSKVRKRRFAMGREEPGEHEEAGVPVAVPGT